MDLRQEIYYYSSFAAFPASGSSNALYVDESNAALYIWDGSAYVLAGDGSGGVTDVTASAPLSSSGGAAPNISISQATTSTNGYLSSTDWNTFNGKADKNPSVQTVTSSATVTPISSNDIVVITAQAAALTLANPTGTWVQGQALMIRIKDNGTARAITFDTNYRAIGVTLPTTTVISKTTYIGIIYNSTDTKWDVIGVTTQA